MHKAHSENSVISDNVTSNSVTDNSTTGKSVTGNSAINKSRINKSVASNDVTSDNAENNSPKSRTSETNRPADDSSAGDKVEASVVPNYQLNGRASETNSELNLNKLNLNPTKATSLRSSFNRLTDFNSILTADLSPDSSANLSAKPSPNVEQTDRTSYRSSYYLESGRRQANGEMTAERLDLDQVEQKISTVRSIQVLSSKHKVELKIDNQIVS